MIPKISMLLSKRFKTERLKGYSQNSILPFLDILLFTDHRLCIYFLSADFIMDSKIIDEVGMYI